MYGRSERRYTVLCRMPSRGRRAAIESSLTGGSMPDQETDAELEQSEIERTEEDLEEATDWVRTCMLEGL